jgi:hypothetical protein
MKTIIKKTLVILIALTVTATLAYAGICSHSSFSKQDKYNQVVFDQLSMGYNDISLY